MAAASAKEKEIFAELDKVYKNDDNYISIWLNNIRNTTTDNVKNPLTGKTISINSKNGVYPIIIKWCIQKYPRDDFTNIPNYQAILSSINANAATPAHAHASPVAAAATNAKPSTAIDFTLIAEKWKKTPTINPFNFILTAL